MKFIHLYKHIVDLSLTNQSHLQEKETENIDF